MAYRLVCSRTGCSLPQSQAGVLQALTSLSDLNGLRILCVRQMYDRAASVSGSNKGTFICINEVGERQILERDNG